MLSKFESTQEKILYISDLVLIFVVIVGIVSSLFFPHDWILYLLAGCSLLGLIPVAYSAIKSLIARSISVDLLASIALIFSLIQNEWFSASFITLMLASARIFDKITDAQAKKTIQSLMKYHVEKVRIHRGESIVEVHIKEVKPGDIVVVESGDRIPVDGVVISGNALINESSLTGESEAVPKKPGDKIFTSTVNESGSLEVRTEKVGADTTLARIIALVDEASRNKSKAERAAGVFTQWYIGIMFAVTIVLYVSGFSSQVILAILLVVCADDIAVAVPLAFTAGIASTARRGVIVKGSAAFEQLSRLKYILTDKTGTLTRGRPKILDIKTYAPYSRELVLDRVGMGASESSHAVSKAINVYIGEHNIPLHAPHRYEEISGQGIIYSHDMDKMLLGRVSLLEKERIVLSDEIKNDIQTEKDAGHGVAVFAINGHIAGLVTYNDELRPHISEVIKETKALGVEEWHMLTGDNDKAAKAVSDTVGIRHYHANMTPESKVQYVSKFRDEHRPAIVGYIGDGVNDAASLALADVSIAMGGIGSDAAIEAADIAIMHDHLQKLPDVLRTAKLLRRIMFQCFVIWGITNAAGLALIGLGIIGPSGAAAYNFLTDFIPIANALRAGHLAKNKNK